MVAVISVDLDQGFLVLRALIFYLLTGMPVVGMSAGRVPRCNRHVQNVGPCRPTKAQFKDSRSKDALIANRLPKRADS